MNTTQSNSLVEPYLFFDGRCEEAIEFYRRALGAEVNMLMRYKDSPEPPQAGSALPPGSENRIMHASLRIGKTMLMVSDGHCGGKAEFPRFRPLGDRAHGRPGGPVVRSAGRRGKGADAIGQDVLFAAFRHGH